MIRKVLPFIVTSCILTLMSGPILAERVDQITSDIDIILERMASRYPLRFVYKGFPESAWPKTHYQMASPSDYPRLLDYLRLFEEEIGKYPQSFFQNRNLRQVFFVKRLFFEERPVEGLYEDSQDLMLFDFLRSQGNPRKQRHNIHHEFYHMIAVGHPALSDIPWEELNTAHFQYGKQAAQSRPEKESNHFAPSQPGFISEYALSSAEEDKAEVYACLFIESQRNLMYRWMQKDEILSRKVAAMKRFIYQYCPQMDEVYWEHLR